MAIAVPCIYMSFFRNLALREELMIMTMEKYIAPVKVLVYENVIYPENIINNRDTQPFFIPYDGSDRVDILTTIKDGGYIVLDFGKELCGGVNITVQWVVNVPDGTDPQLNIVFGESVMEALAELNEKNANNAHGVRNLTVPVSGMSSVNYGRTGFRFVKIKAIGGDVLFNGIKAYKEMREIEYKGSFECNDELLNKIWKTGAYTVELNMHDYLWDGVKRDRLTWIGDMHPEVSTIAAAFGNDSCVQKSLDFCTKYMPPEKWLNGIATYSMWWIMIQHKWYMNFGNLKYLKEQEDYLTALVKHILDWIENSVSDEDMGFEGFVDWSSEGDSFSRTEGRRSITCMSLDCAGELFDVLGDKDIAAQCREMVDILRNEDVTAPANKRMSALTILSGRDDKYAKDVLKGNSAEEMSCFMGYYVLLAKAKMGDYKDALDIIREYWGGMLKMGATTFWEDFDIKWLENASPIDRITPDGKKDIHGDFGRFCYKNFRHSLCHGWASGPTPFLSEKIGGIEILEPGCRKVRISPNLGDLEWIKVAYPTPFGNIKIYAYHENEELKVQIEAPNEIEIVQ